MPFGSLLFFGNNGGDDQFALALPRPDVVVCAHESDSRRVADDMCGYLGRFLAAGGNGWY